MVGCIATSRSFQLTCEDGEWQGSVGTCPTGTSKTGQSFLVFKFYSRVLFSPTPAFYLFFAGVLVLVLDPALAIGLFLGFVLFLATPLPNSING